MLKTNGGVGMVFISYSHDSDVHKRRVGDLAARLRRDGVSVAIDADMLPGGPNEGWDVWSEAKVKQADRVLVACTETYCRRYESRESPQTGLGAVCEALTIRELINQAGGINEKFRVVLFAPEDSGHVPTQLARYHRFSLVEPQGYYDLLGWLRGGLSGGVAEPDMTQQIRWPATPPGFVWPLADRKSESALFAAMAAGQSTTRVLLVQGVSNTGKTILLSELRAYAKLLKLQSSFLDFKGCPSLDDVFQTLLLDLGPGTLRRSHAASGTSRFYELIADLRGLSQPVALFFDTYEQAPADAQKWIDGQLLARLDQAPAIIVVAAGQAIPQSAKHLWAGLAETRILQPILREGDWLEYVASRWPWVDVQSERVRGLIVGIALGCKGDPGQVSAILASVMMQSQQALAGN